jgi:hypothetical protein
VRLLIAFIAVLLVLTLGGTALACDCVTGSPDQNFQYADVVFEGQVSRITTTTSETAYTFRVSKLLKGAPASELTVSGGFTDCDMHFWENTIYRVYAHRFEGKLISGQCAGNKILGCIQVKRYSTETSWSQVFRFLPSVAVGLLATIIWLLIRRRA